MRDIIKTYQMPENIGAPKRNETMETYIHKMAFEEITKSFSEKRDDEIISYLYDKYKDTDISEVFVLSKEDFKEFLLEMLPKWREK